MKKDEFEVNKAAKIGAFTFLIASLCVAFTLAILGLIERANDYKYAVRTPRFAIYSEAEETEKYESAANEKYEKLLGTSKRKIENLISRDKNDYLNWERFDDLKNVKKLTYSSNMSNSLKEFSNSFLATYSEEESAVILWPLFSSLNSSFKEGVLIHESLHPLFFNENESERKRYSQLTEGIVEYYTEKISARNNLSIVPSYSTNVFAVEKLMKIYGERTVAEAIESGEIIDLIDSSTARGMCSRLNLAVYHVNEDDDENGDMENAILDILFHAAKAEGLNLSTKEKAAWIDELSSICGSPADINYFENL